MQAKSIKGNSAAAIEPAIRDANTDGFKPTLAIIFISVKQDRNRICEIFKKEKIYFIGATSAAEFINGHQSEGEIVKLLLDINNNNYRIQFIDTPKLKAATNANQGSEFTIILPVN